MTEKGYMGGSRWASAAGLCALLLTGCGGGGGGGSTSPPSPSPFAGSWVQSTASGPVGSSLVIDSQGNVSGTVAPDPASPHVATEISGGVSGTISDGGSLGLTASGSGDGLGGTLSVDSRGHLVGGIQEVGPNVPCPQGNSCPGVALPYYGTIQIDMTKSD